MRKSIILGYCLAFLCCCANAQRGADLTATFHHCIPAEGQRGIIRLEIDTAASAGPFDLFLEGPDSLRDTVIAWPRHTFLYENTAAGRYCITVRCCDTCTAIACGDINNYELLQSGELAILLTRAKTPHRLDAGAILLACTIIQQGPTGDTAYFSLYALPGRPLPDLPGMLQNAVEGIRLMGGTGFWAERQPTYGSPDDLPEDDPHGWVPEPFVALVRMDGRGEVVWVMLY